MIQPVSQKLVEAAGRFADGFALRGYDNVQLAAAHELHITSEQPVTFACYDRRAPSTGGVVMTSTPADASEMDHLDQLGAKAFAGFLVRKDLVR